MLPKRVLYYGKDEELPPQIPLRAGALEILYENGDLRYVSFRGIEVIRRVYSAVRDRNWGTVPALLSNEKIQIQEDSFSISYEVEHRQKEIHFYWRGAIRGEADGTITFSVDGEALSTFWRSRIGFCVLHPSALRGKAVQIQHIDGSLEQAIFPIDFVAVEPMEPFTNMSGISYEIIPGTKVDVSFFGDIFEMEDQRNWTDASYKTFCTPLNLPSPVEIAAGTKLSQSVTIRLKECQPEGSVKNHQDLNEEANGHTITISQCRHKEHFAVPKIGLLLGQDRNALTKNECDYLRKLHIHHLRVDLHLANPDYHNVLEQAMAEVGKVGASLEVAIFTRDEPHEELQAFCQVIDHLKPPVSAWLCFPEREEYSGGPDNAIVSEAAWRVLKSYDASIPLYVGTNSDFIFLKRNRPPLDRVDGLTFSICPQVHAFDNATMVENLEAQGEAVSNARRLGQGKPVMVSPVTMRMRFNPYATAEDPELTGGELPAQVDVRQMSLFGAAWTLGSIRSLAEAGVSSITFYETTGWKGVLETDLGSSLPEKFFSIPRGVYPIYHILSAVGDFRDGVIQPIDVSHPLKVTGLLLQKGKKERQIVTNLTSINQIIFMKTFHGEYQMRILDEKNVIDTMKDPNNLWTRYSQNAFQSDGEIVLNLLPYATLILDKNS